MKYFRIDTNEFVDADVMNAIETLDEAIEYFKENVNYIDMLAPGVVEDISGAIYMFAGLIGEDNGIAVFLPIGEDMYSAGYKDTYLKPSDVTIIEDGIFYCISNNTEYLVIREC